MKILLSFLLIILVALTSGTHLYYVWKGKNYKMLYVQLGIISLAIIAGVMSIYHFQEPSISTLFNKISPLEK